LETKAKAIKRALSADTGRLSKTTAYYVAFIALGTTGAVLGPTKAGLAENTQTQLSQISLLFTAGSLGYLLGSLLSGRLFDRMPGHPVMAAGLIFMAAMLGLAPLAPLLWLLFAVFLILGIAQAAVDVGGNTLLVWIHGDQVPPFMSGLHFFFGLGAFLSPVIIALAVVPSGEITWAYWALAILMLPVAIWLLRLRSPAIQGDSENDLSRPVDRRLLALMVAFFFLHVAAELSFGGWIFDYAVTLGLNSSTTSSYLLNSAFWGALTLGRLLSIPIAIRFRPGTILLGALVGCLVSLVVILGWPASSVAVWLGTVGMGLSIAPMFPTSINLAERRMAITGQVTSWFLVGASLGSMSVPWLIGQLFESVGPQVAMVIILIDMILALVVFGIIKLGFSAAGSDPGQRTTRPI
jgi:FHS family Na+ dependent glucose MFS transporter 1